MFRYILFGVFLFTCFSSGGALYYLCFCHDFSQRLKDKKSESIWNERQKELSDSVLHYLPAQQQRSHLVCFQGFLLQKQQKFSQADRIFSKLYDEVKDGPFLFREEILGGRLINSFFLEKIDVMETVLCLLHQCCPNSPYYHLFKALLCYKQHRFSEVTHQLTCWQEEKEKGMAPLLNLSLEHLLSDFFLDYIFAHSQIEQKMFAEGRVILNRNINKLLKHESEWNAKTYDRIVLLLCRSYLLELLESDSKHIYSDYYEMVLFYLKKIYILEQSPYAEFLPEQELISLIMKHIFILPKEKLQPLIQILEIWQKHYVNPDSALIVQTLVTQFSHRIEEVISFCEAITSFPGLEELRQQVVMTFGSLLANKVQQIETEEAKQCVAILHVLDPSISISEKLALSSDTLNNIVSKDDEKHTKLQNYLDLWKAIQSYDIDRQQLVQHLVHGAKDLWQQGGNDEKALNLLHLVLQFTGYDIECESVVFLFVKQVYKQALSSHAISRLLKLENFISETKLPVVVISEAEKANFLADAEYLFAHGDYNKCYLYSLWLTKIAPSSQAYRLAGLCLMENKCYDQALEFLCMLPLTDSLNDHRTQKALAFCQKYQSKDSDFS
ncbi:Protein of unknown function (DUF1347) [Chlamydia serpentis]|uniref:Uncharacterized protein n=1 Tax=Chlamydia serpentis TaxID=1967782 RepID=A0A2R8FC24_9CHLA|nr:DUF1347 family protein [Chlamydia serpentis]SPN73866.1 Protein of unknown function (DUF1347) [Chlamydia serpentis]